MSNSIYEQQQPAPATSAPQPSRPSFSARVAHLFRTEFGGLHVRLILANLLLAPLPIFVGPRVRSLVMRLIGFDIGKGTLMWGLPSINGRGAIYGRLKVGRLCRFNVGCFLELGAAITIDDLVGFGPQVMILTTTHDVGPSGRRSGAPRSLPVHIGKGCWIGARATILPGVTIGPGSIVGAGAVVTRDVPPNTVVAGVPAKVVKELE